MNLFNIGVEGQYFIGMITAAWAALSLDFLPGPVLVVAALLAAMLGGMIWAAIPGLLKVKTGAHEVVTTIMLNGIAISLVAYVLNGPLKFSDAPEGQNVDLRTDLFPDKALIGDLGKSFGITPGAHLSWLFLVAVIAAIIVWFLLRRTRLGYEARAVGSSPGSARAGGISIGSTQVRLFVISGALAGLVGMQQILAQEGIFSDAFAPEVSLLLFSMVVIGGLGSLSGVILGAVYIRGVQFFLPTQYALLASGVGILFLLVFLPEGLGGLMYRGRDGYLRWVARRRDILVPSLVADKRVEEDADQPSDEVDMLRGALAGAPGGGR